MYSILSKKPKQRVEKNENNESQGDASKSNRSFNQGREESSNNEKIIKVVQLDMGINSEGKADQKMQEIISDNSEDRSSGGRYSQINNEVMLSQDPQCDDEKERPQNKVDNKQPENNKNKTVETLRTSTRTKKIPSTRGEDFLW